MLQSLEDDPVTAHAARLTGEQFAEVFRRYVQERRETVPDLVELLREAVRGARRPRHGAVGVHRGVGRGDPDGPNGL